MAKKAPKSEPGRISERDLVLPTLRLLSESPNGCMTTSELIHELRILLHPTGKDAEIAKSRSDDYFSEKVRNLVSHRQDNFIAEGLAIYHPELGRNTGGLEITPAGRDHVAHAYAHR